MSYPGKLTLVSYSRGRASLPAQGDGLGQVGGADDAEPTADTQERCYYPVIWTYPRQQEVARLDLAHSL
jgi:hypothetical protein